MDTDSGHFYVYVYQDPRIEGPYKFDDYTFKFRPFYVGKGSGKRYAYHLRCTDSANQAKNYIIKSILDSGLSPVIDFVFRTDNEPLAYSIETKLIAAIGMMGKGGYLVNLADGTLDSTVSKWWELHQQYPNGFPEWRAIRQYGLSHIRKAVSDLLGFSPLILRRKTSFLLNVGKGAVGQNNAKIILENCSLSCEVEIPDRTRNNQPYYLPIDSLEDIKCRAQGEDKDVFVIIKRKRLNKS